MLVCVCVCVCVRACVTIRPRCVAKTEEMAAKCSVGQVYQ